MKKKRKDTASKSQVLSPALKSLLKVTQILEMRVIHQGQEGNKRKERLNKLTNRPRDNDKLNT